jgi:TPR repeat protein/uncharacterized RDD family membrane protein YckC
MITGVTAKQNPFPGLRPFREDEERFFFGRESQVDTMVNKLAATRFLAVVGTSGSGKSSLVNCGLRPALHRGLMAGAGPAWRIAKFRPDVNPIHSLAKALAAEGVLYSGYKEDVPIEEIIETYLHGSCKGVVETFRKARLPEGTNLLVVADQFEEIFRYGKLRTEDGKDADTISENAIAFVNLLLEARAEPNCPIYVVITMRSDFLGECSQFYGLPEAINEGEYLVPRMTRDERRASIEGPLSVGGAEISPVLMTRLLNDVGDNPDQLSILQHALNRTWACWEIHGAEGELDLEHYMEIGTMAKALNHHADEAFEQLETPDRAKICEKLFKALTDDRRGIRRPQKLATLSEIAGTGSEEEVKAVIEVFREPSRSFLMPPVPEPLEPEKMIDISHESLMRVWERLRDWAKDEARSARRYRRLAETAALEKKGKTGLWRDPELQLALDWKEEQAPTPGWANLYGGDFESASAFLEKSRSERDHERAEVVFERWWKRIRLLIILLIAGIFLWRLIAGFFLWKHFPGEFEWLLDKVGYERNVKVLAVPAPQAGSAPLEQRLQAVRGIYDVNDLRLLAALACDVGLYLLGYFALTYFGRLVFRRFAFARVLHKVALSSSKAVREQKLAEQALAYASFWRRLGAYVLDLGLVTVGSMVGIAVFVMGCFLYVAKFIDSHPGFLFAGVLLILLVVDWLYQAMMLSSRRQATLGKLALGIFVTDQKGDGLPFGWATARHFAAFLSYITVGIGCFIQPFTRKHQTLHDLIVRSVVLVRPDKKKVQRWIVVPCVIIGLMEASLASLLGFGLIAAELAPKWEAAALQKAANQGDAAAQNNLGLHYEIGWGVPKDLGKAAELYQKAADQGNARAQTNLGSLYQSGQGVPKDLKKAADLYQKAADQGNADAQTNLGSLYQSGQGVPKDLEKAADLYQKAANQGNAFGQNNLGWLYESGQGVPKDLKKAADLYQKAANQGDADAQNNLGWLYESGQGVPKDLDKAAAHFRKVAELYQKAADQGDATAQVNLGWLYENGQGVPKDLAKAAELYQKAADKGYAPAQVNLGWLYQNGQGVPKDLDKAAAHFRKAAELYQKAADQGDADAQERLGRLYQNGRGVPKDLGKAADLYQKAADKGDGMAQINLGWLYQNGQGVPKDFGKAAELYQKAADQRYAAALGWLYENGQGVPKDLGKAADLYQKDADLGRSGRAFAQNNLGWLYESGQGVPKDLRKAVELYQKAANHGYEPAIANLKRLSEH